MKKCFKVPLRVEVALKNYKVAIEQRKKAEKEVIDCLRFSAQLIYECPSINVAILAQDFDKAYKALLKAYMFEFECSDALAIERKKANFYE